MGPGTEEWWMGRCGHDPHLENSMAVMTKFEGKKSGGIIY